MYADPRNHNFQSKASVNTVQQDRLNNYQSKQSMGTIGSSDRGQAYAKPSSSAQHPPQMTVQPNMPMQHYATSQGSTQGSGQMVKQSS